MLSGKGETTVKNEVAEEISASPTTKVCTKVLARVKKESDCNNFVVRKTTAAKDQKIDPVCKYWSKTSKGLSYNTPWTLLAG